MLIEIDTFWFKKTHVKMSSVEKCQLCLGLNVLKVIYNFKLQQHYVIDLDGYCKQFLSLDVNRRMFSVRILDVAGNQ